MLRKLMENMKQFEDDQNTIMEISLMENTKQSESENMDDTIIETPDIVENNTNKIKKKSKKVQKMIVDKCEWFCGESINPCRQPKELESKYCKKHQFVNKYTDAQKANIKFCKSCRNVRPVMKGCDQCDIINKKRKMEKDEKKKKVAQEGFKICGTCVQEKPLNSFKGVAKADTTSCKECRDKNKEADKKRENRVRDEAAELANNPERRAKKLANMTEYNAKKRAQKE